MTIRERFELVDYARDTQPADFAREVGSGLGSNPKTLPCRFFYDQHGSLLFDAITRLPEYYLTSVELEILQRCAPELARCFPGPLELVELGSGSATKTRILIRAFLQERGTLRYIPLYARGEMPTVMASLMLLIPNSPGFRVARPMRTMYSRSRSSM